MGRGPNPTLSNNYLQISKNDAHLMVRKNSFIRRWRSMKLHDLVQIRNGDFIRLAPRLQDIFLLTATASLMK